jgi:hypothetical protein
MGRGGSLRCAIGTAVLLFLAILAVLALTGCKKAEVVEPAGKIAYFKASKYTVPIYDPVTLSWSVSDSSMVMLSGIGLVDPVGNVMVNPQETTVYTLLAVGLDKETTSQRLTVNIDKAPACGGLAIRGSTGVRDGMEVEVGPNANAYYSAKNVLIEVKLFDGDNKLMETGTGIIPEIPPGQYGTILVRLKKSLYQARSECAIVSCSCDFTRPN